MVEPLPDTNPELRRLIEQIEEMARRVNAVFTIDADKLKAYMAARRRW